MRRQLALVPILLVVGCASHGEAGALVSEIDGAELVGGYRVTDVEIGELSMKVRMDGPEGGVVVVFSRRDDSSEAFTRTASCDVRYFANLPEGSPTPEGLSLAVQDLADRVSARDSACRGFVTSSVQEQDGAGCPWHWLLFSILALAALGALASRIPERHAKCAFWAAVAGITVVGLILRTADLGGVFCNGVYPERAELAARPLWKILAMVEGDPRHPPLTSLILHLVLVFGREEWMLRLPFAILSSASLPLVALLGRRMGGPVAGLAAALVCAIATPLVILGQQVGSHALFPLASVGVLLAHDRLLASPSTRTAIVLGVADGLALWTHYFCAFVVVFQIVDLARRPQARIELGRALVLGGIVSALPVFHLVTALARDVGWRLGGGEMSGVDASVGSMVGGMVEAHGMAFSIALAALAVVGTVLMALRGRDAAAWVAASGWLLACVILALAPVARILTHYLGLAVPLLAVTAAAGCELLARRIALSLALRVHVVARGAIAAGLCSVLVVLSAWHHHRHSGRFWDAERICSIPEAARVIRAGGKGTVALVHGYSVYHLGFYLADEVRPPSEVERSADDFRYGAYRVRVLDEHRMSDPHWRSRAEGRLRGIVDAQGKAWLLDMPHVERTWPGLERAGSCRVHRRYFDLRLLECGN